MSNTKVITFKIVDESGKPRTFKMKTEDPIRKAFDVYCQRTNKTIDISRYIFNGQLIDASDSKETPESLGMVDGDTIDVVQNNKREDSSERYLKPKLAGLSFDDKIDFKFVDGNGRSMNFKMNMIDPIQKAIKVYCERTNMSIHSLRFWHGNYCIDPHEIIDTPNTMGMKDKDVIVVQQYTDDGN